MLRTLLHHNRSIKGILTIVAILIIALIVGITFSIMSFFRVFNMADDQIYEALTREGDAILARFDLHAERTAALGLSLSQQLSTSLSSFLSKRGLTMDELNDRPELIAELEEDAYPTLSMAMQLAECSAVFMALNVTADTKREPPSRSGLFLKFRNIFSIHPSVNSDITVLRGTPSIASKIGSVSMHNAWDLEMEQGFFAELDSMIFAREPIQAYPRGTFILTNITAYRQTSEIGRLFIFPINYRGRVVGACGFEVDGTIFRLAHRTSDASGLQTRFALFNKVGFRYVGQMTDSRSSVRNHTGVDEFRISAGSPFSIIESGGERFIAQLRDISVGASHHTAAFMIPEDVYELQKKRWHMRTIAFYATVYAVVIIVVIVLRWLVLRYILRGIADLGESTGGAHKIKEFDFIRSRMDQLASQSLRDPLTGAGNRVRLDASFEVMMSGSEHAWTLVLTDLDGFKNINGEFGHSVGDEYLREFARELFSAPGGEVFRYGGDEFCLIFKGKNEEAVRAICRNIALRFESSEIVAKYAPITVSCGVAVWDGAESPSQLVRRAHDDMIRAKSADR